MITAQDVINNDSRLRVEIDHDGTSPNIEKAIWSGQHVCVSESPSLSDSVTNPGEAVIKNQLRVEHYSVLKHAFLKLHCYGFPHSTMTQITRHQDSGFLVQSGRYTGQRFVDVANDKRSVKDVFYFRPIGEYQSRQGQRYNYSIIDHGEELEAAYEGCLKYRDKINFGWSEEHARAHSINYESRQDFVVSGTIEAFFHWLDQRSKKDAQLEIQALAWLALEQFKAVAPTFGQWYEDVRWGKARLAP